MFASQSYPGHSLLGGSWVVIGRVRSPLIWVIRKATLLVVTLLVPTHEPPSREGGE